MWATKAPFLLHEGKLKGLDRRKVWWAAEGLNLEYVPASGTERGDGSQRAHLFSPCVLVQVGGLL